jgi:hypothetical protein
MRLAVSRRLFSINGGDPEIRLCAQLRRPETSRRYAGAIRVAEGAVMYGFEAEVGAP